MRLTVWGSRGSLPVCGAEYLRYGGDTTCLEVTTSKGDTIILDAGTGMRRLGNKLLKEGKKEFHLVLTHAHWDHLWGLPFFKPLFQNGVTIHVYGCMSARESVRSIIASAMKPPYFPINIDDVSATLNYHDLCSEPSLVGSSLCSTFPLNHPNGGTAIRVEEAGRKLAFFPDNEIGFHHPDGGNYQELVEFVHGVDLLIHDAEYTRDEYDRYTRGWGHSVFLDTVQLALEAKVKRLLMWHLNQERSDHQADSMVEEAREKIADAGANLPCDYASVGMCIDLPPANSA